MARENRTHWKNLVDLHSSQGGKRLTHACESSYVLEWTEPDNTVRTFVYRIHANAEARLEMMRRSFHKLKQAGDGSVTVTWMEDDRKTRGDMVFPKMGRKVTNVVHDLQVLKGDPGVVGPRIRPPKRGERGFHNPVTNHCVEPGGERGQFMTDLEPVEYQRALPPFVNTAAPIAPVSLKYMPDLESVRLPNARAKLRSSVMTYKAVNLPGSDEHSFPIAWPRNSAQLNFDHPFTPIDNARTIMINFLNQSYPNYTANDRAQPVVFKLPRDGFGDLPAKLMRQDQSRGFTKRSFGQPFMQQLVRLYVWLYTFTGNKVTPDDRDRYPDAVYTPYRVIYANRDGKPATLVRQMYDSLAEFKYANADRLLIPLTLIDTTPPADEDEKAPVIDRRVKYTRCVNVTGVLRRGNNPELDIYVHRLQMKGMHKTIGQAIEAIHIFCSHIIHRQKVLAGHNPTMFARIKMTVLETGKLVSHTPFTNHFFEYWALQGVTADQWPSIRPDVAQDNLAAYLHDLDEFLTPWLPSQLNAASAVMMLRKPNFTRANRRTHPFRYDDYVRNRNPGAELVPVQRPARQRRSRRSAPSVAQNLDDASAASGSRVVSGASFYSDITADDTTLLRSPPSQ